MGSLDILRGIIMIEILLAAIIFVLLCIYLSMCGVKIVIVIFALLIIKVLLEDVNRKG